MGTLWVAGPALAQHLFFHGLSLQMTAKGESIWEQERDVLHQGNSWVIVKNEQYSVNIVVATMAQAICCRNMTSNTVATTKIGVSASGLEHCQRNEDTSQMAKGSKHMIGLSNIELNQGDPSCDMRTERRNYARHIHCTFDWYSYCVSFLHFECSTVCHYPLWTCLGAFCGHTIGYILRAVKVGEDHTYL